MAGMFEGRVKCLEQEQCMAGNSKINVEGALKGAHCWQGFGVRGPFLHGTWKGAELLLATTMA